MSLDMAFSLGIVAIVFFFLTLQLAEVGLQRLWRRLWTREKREAKPRFPWSKRTGT